MNENLVNLIVTVVSGVLVFTLGQLFVEYILRPVQEYKKLKARVAKELVRQAMYYENPKNIAICAEFPEWQKGSLIIRELAAEVLAFAEIKPPQWMAVGLIPTKKALTEVSQNLIGLSNIFFAPIDDMDFVGQKREEFTTEIEEVLHISKIYM